MRDFKSIIAILMLFMVCKAYAEYDLKAVQKAIQEKGVTWHAEENWVTKLLDKDMRHLTNVDLDQINASANKELTIHKQSNLPTHFDWRDNNGDWLTPVKNQGDCGSCQVFAGMAMIEAWWKIKNNAPEMNVDLSEQFLMSCTDVIGCDGGNINLAFGYIQEFGIPPESCMPYQANDAIPCEEKCEDWEAHAVKIPEWGYITNFQNDIDLIKSALVQQPILAWFYVYNDFYSYKSGVYERTTEDLVNGHSILIIGWDDNDQCWICKNSWGPEWGEDGYFRIKWGECNIGQNACMIHDVQGDNASLFYNANQYHFNLKYGASLTDSITIFNTGSKDVVCYDETFASGIEHMFQAGSFLSYDSLSLWLGNSELDRYHRNFVSFLDLPLLDLKAANRPLLSLQSQWYFCRSVIWESRSYFDGFNVWISQDSGSTFELLQPTVGEYNCHSLVPFGYFTDTNIPWQFKINTLDGWADVQSSWQPFEFDLSKYRTGDIVIRFFVISSGDDGLFIIDGVRPQYGVFLDEIYVRDGDDILFENHGDNFKDLTRMSVYFEKSHDWLIPAKNSFDIQAGSTINLGFKVDSKFLEPGKFKGYIGFNTNEPKDVANVNAANYYIPVTLNVEAPDQDVVIKESLTELEQPSLCLTNRFGAVVVNIGSQEMTNVFIECQVKTPQTILFDTLQISTMKPQQQQEVYFEPAVISATGNYEITTTLLDHPNDANAFNNTASINVSVSNLINNFDCDSALWVCDAGFGITNKMNAHSAPNGAHVSNGQTPYPDNMDATLSLRKPIHIGMLDKATLKYWVRGLSEPDQDILFTEVSTDRSSWIVVDSVSGAIVSWNQREVDLSRFIDSEASKLWLRYHFISDAQNGSLGFVIDDVEIYNSFPTSVCSPAKQITASDYILYQNYPNPFNPQTTIRYELPTTCQARVQIINMRGQVVRTLVQGEQAAGRHSVQWDGRDNNGKAAGSGVYLYRLYGGEKLAAANKMVLLQ